MISFIDDMGVQWECYYLKSSFVAMCWQWNVVITGKLINEQIEAFKYWQGGAEIEFTLSNISLLEMHSVSTVTNQILKYYNEEKKRQNAGL